MAEVQIMQEQLSAIRGYTNNMSKFSICLLIFMFAASIQAGMYKWVDEQGVTHYGDKPPADRETLEINGRISSYTSPQVDKLPEDFFGYPKAAPTNTRVVMYSASWCSICKQAKTYFQQKHIPFKEYDVDTSQKGKKDFQKLGGEGVPVILVGNQRMNGFSAGRFEQLYNP